MTIQAMHDLLGWLGQMGNSKTLALLLFFPMFCAILIYLFGSRQRAQRLESYRFIPLDDELDGPADRPRQGDGE